MEGGARQRLRTVFPEPFLPTILPRFVCVGTVGWLASTSEGGGFSHA